MKSIAELEDQFKGERIPYQVLLQTKEWFTRRAEIIRRDKEMCCSCRNKTTEYAIGKHIWIMEGFKMVKRESEPFLKEWEYYENLLGDKFVGMRVHEEGLEEVPEPHEAVVVLDRQHYLQVHHKLYIDSRYPWEYEDEHLITLCNWCHFEVHQKEAISVYKIVNGVLVQEDRVPCGRCGGAGFFPQYLHVQSGECFECKGERYVSFI